MSHVSPVASERVLNAPLSVDCKVQPETKLSESLFKETCNVHIWYCHSRKLLVDVTRFLTYKKPDWKAQISLPQAFNATQTLKWILAPFPKDLIVLQILYMLQHKVVYTYGLTRPAGCTQCFQEPDILELHSTHAQAFFQNPKTMYTHLLVFEPIKANLT